MLKMRERSSFLLEKELHVCLAFQLGDELLNLSLFFLLSFCIQRAIGFENSIGLLQEIGCILLGDGITFLLEWWQDINQNKVKTSV